MSLGKVLCKKTLISNSFSTICIYYKKNHYYDISENHYGDRNTIFIKNERGTDLAFVYDKKIPNIGNWGEIKDYFITEKELRKNKLKKIHEVR